MVLDTENVGAAVAAAANNSDILETIADQKASDVTLEGLPRSLKKPTGVEEWFAHVTRPRRISAIAVSKPRG